MADRSYTPDERKDILRQVLLLGTPRAAAEACGVPEGTIKSWKTLQREWWDRTINELVTEMEGDYRPGWVRVMGLAVDAIQDRIEHGDAVMTKEGVKRVPMKGKDLGVLAGIAADKLKQFGVASTAVKDSAEKRRKDLAELAKQDRELAQMPLNKPVEVHPN